MSMCPLCNGISVIEESCEVCHSVMSDKGRLMDYFDDYSAYLDIEGMKLFDGIKNDAQNQQCPHIFYCSKCHIEKTLLIQEEAH
ncbi:hypothetical protein H1D32_18240 [Anaerobacillus sp. CMMVII]|uniref:hypothetical protein n=1 Tax=Anaerobacillus sp. CMMVII TaxID=2755588 RepID=UPI0021B77627|nr:hypothetical protein [Anaerobacillus sp. CMMVII]MCT8139473.1 hypothetical protein [Anaerobacillus sp. CMMVII]